MAQARTVVHGCARNEPAGPENNGCKAYAHTGVEYVKGVNFGTLNGVGEITGLVVTIRN